jgi:hypothetical protein
VFSVSRTRDRAVTAVTSYAEQQTVTLPITCQSCAATLDVTLRDWSYGGRIHTAPVKCPVCQHPNVVALHGRLESVKARE